MLKNILIFIIMSAPLLAVANTSATDFMAIKQSAILANATYANETDMGQQLISEGFTVLHHKELAESQVSYFLAQKGQVQFVAVRGTANVQNAMVDLDVHLKPDSELNIILHQGFSLAAKAIYADLLPILKRQQVQQAPLIQTTGHSLGGAVAVIVGMYLQRDGYNVQNVITFGQPKVTNVTGAQSFENLPLTRVVTPLDMVPLVPPISPLQLKDLDIYWHLGQEIILLAEHQYAKTSGIKSMLRATKFASALPDEKNLQAHQMSTYLWLINSNLQHSAEVEHKTGISLFGLSLD